MKEKSGRKNPHNVRVEQARAREAQARNGLARVQTELHAVNERNNRLELENQILRKGVKATGAVEKAERSLFKDALFFGLLVLLPEATDGLMEGVLPSLESVHRHAISLGFAVVLMVLYVGAKKADQWWESRKGKSRTGLPAKA